MLSHSVCFFLVRQREITADTGISNDSAHTNEVM